MVVMGDPPRGPKPALRIDDPGSAPLCPKDRRTLAPHAANGSRHSRWRACYNKVAASGGVWACDGNNVFARSRVKTSRLGHIHWLAPKVYHPKPSLRQVSSDRTRRDAVIPTEQGTSAIQTVHVERTDGTVLEQYW